MTRDRPHMERALFVVGRQNAGKSTLLRHMFIDPRLGSAGEIPAQSRIKLICLSQERCLSIRCTSPHERNETLDDFLDKVDKAMRKAWRDYWRFNFACALQPTTDAKMPDLLTTCKGFKKRFSPERIRVIQINPCRDGHPGSLLTEKEIDDLRTLEVEMAVVDGRQPSKSSFPNGFFLADFFDFS